MALNRPAFGMAVLVAMLSFAASACSRGPGHAPSRAEAASFSDIAPNPVDTEARRVQMREIQERVRRDPEDFVELNRLADAYLQSARETSRAEDIALAMRAARASLDSVPDIRNPGGLTALTQAEFASHEFISARDHALRLIELEPRKSYPYALLGDTLLEIGDYDEAAAAYKSMDDRSGSMTHGSEARAARLAFLRGDTTSTTGHLTTALTLALNLPSPPREPVAWYRWQLGETAFSTGEYASAEGFYRASLTSLPGYSRAVAGLARVRAAQGAIDEAIQLYETVVGRLPDPAFVAALGDLYRATGRTKESQEQYRLVEAIGRLSAANGVLYNRQLALFYADHDTSAELGYSNAVNEFQTRHDIYGADAVAWTALKAGKLPEAQNAIRAALRLGTKDPMILYHAGMIAHAVGDEGSAVTYLREALGRSPRFSVIQADEAQRVLGALEKDDAVRAPGPSG